MDLYVLMKPDGQLIIIDWNKTEYPIGLSIREKVSLDKMKYLAELYNLEIVKTFIVSEFFYGLIAKAGENFERKNYYYRLVKYEPSNFRIAK